MFKLTIPRFSKSFLIYRKYSVVSGAASTSFFKKFTGVGGQNYSSTIDHLTKEQVEERVFNVLKAFDKVVTTNPTFKPTSSFTSDLGLDSLDVVEVIMAVEEEFGIEIPDEAAEKITTVGSAVKYISENM